MHKLNILNLYMLQSVPSSYCNLWWAGAIRQSIEKNEGFALKVLTQDDVSLDTAMMNGRYIYYPTFTNKVEPGFYHINAQTTSQMFAGFIEIVSEQEAFWWGTDGTDNVFAGYAGDSDLISNHNSGHTGEMMQWLGVINYTDKFDIDKDIYSILKPF